MNRTSRRFTVVLASTALLAVPLSATSLSANAAVKAKHYTSCAQLQRDFPHGVAQKGARDRVKGKTKPVTNFKVSTKIYKMNDGPRNKKTGEYDLDRDNDGVACEKR